MCQEQVVYLMDIQPTKLYYKHIKNLIIYFFLANTKIAKCRIYIHIDYLFLFSIKCQVSQLFVAQLVNMQ